MLFGTLGTLTAIAAVACLFASWNKRLLNGWVVPAGWLLMLLAAGFWIAASGAEFGVSYTLLLLPLAAWALAFASRDRREQKTRPQEQGRLNRPGLKALLKHTGLLLAVVPLAGISSMVFCMALLSLLPLSAVNAIVLSVFITPIVWGAVAYWITADTRILRPLATVIIAGGAGAAVIFL